MRVKRTTKNQKLETKTLACVALPFSSLNDDEVLALLRKHAIGLSIAEARKVTQMLGRDPTLVEATIWGIQGSEHCSYKSSKRFLRTFPTKSRHVILGPGEDSGIVAMTDAPKGKRWGLVISHESHNHPSQIVPFEGAATGIGGVVRDVVCMGARVIGCMDMLRFGDLQTEESRAIASEVIRGIGGYGNPLGIPNLGGDTAFDASYNSNCLVNAVALGIVREDEVIHSIVPAEAGKVGYDIIVIGKPTDRSGFGGASFASASLEEEKRESAAGAVQEPNPFLERHILASTYALFDWIIDSGHLAKVSFKDLGAGGVVCASVEQVAAAGLGADIDLERIHVSIPDLPPEVIACAETQERLCWICHPDLTKHILEHYNTHWDLPSVAEGARASVIGNVTNDGIYRLRFRGHTVCKAKASDITCGLQYNRETKPAVIRREEPEIACDGNVISVRRPTSDVRFPISDVFLAMLSHPNNASKSPAFRHFDKTVIGNTVIEAGEADAAVIAPLQDLQCYVHEGAHRGWDVAESEKWRGVAVAADGNGRYGRISPYWQGANAALEAMRNVAAIGATPRALTDCLNYGNPEIPEQLSALEEGVRGIADAARAVRFDAECVPVISGNVSLYNSRPDGLSIDPTAIVACIGVIPDARRAVTMQLKRPDSVLTLIGPRKDECGGSRYYEALELLGANVPQPDFTEAQREMALVIDAIARGEVLACHDISDGGLLLALFEMTQPARKMGGDIGIDVDLEAVAESRGSPLRSDVLLFSETPGFILETPSALTGAIPIGRTTSTPRILIRRGPKILFDLPLADCRMRFENGLQRALSRE